MFAAHEDSVSELVQYLEGLREGALAAIGEPRRLVPWTPPFAPREAALFLRGLREGVYAVDGTGGFRVPSKPGSAYRLFSDYRSNRSLGLNREYVTQLATLAELVLELGHPGERCLIEKDLWDIVVHDAGGRRWIHVETKKVRGELESLLAGLERYRHGVPLDAPDRGDDPLRKSKYIVRDRPRVLWLVSPTWRAAHAVAVEGTAFELTPLAGVPALDPLPARDG